MMARAAFNLVKAGIFRPMTTDDDLGQLFAESKLLLTVISRHEVDAASNGNYDHFDQAHTV